MNDDDVLVTGANGYVGTHVTAALLREGHRVRGVVRTPERGDQLLRALHRGGVDVDGRLSFAYAQLESDGGWRSALSGVRDVMHIASPFPAAGHIAQEDVVAPARDGAIRVLTAARDAGARRVVMTSSFAAVGYSRKQPPVFTEEDWTNPADDLQPYIKSKVVAERAAWDFIEHESDGLELSVINPVGIFGPAWGPNLSTSVGFVRSMLNGDMASLPDQHFGVVDVRDVATLHLLALACEPAAGQRFLAVADGPAISFVDLARILREARGSIAAHVPLDVSNSSSDGSDPQSIPVISNAKSRTVLGWRPRSVRQTILDTADSLVALGLVGHAGDQRARAADPGK